MTQRDIRSGKYYWVEINGFRGKVLAVKPSATGFWWICKTRSGSEIMVPIADFREEYEEYADNRSEKAG